MILPVGIQRVVTVIVVALGLTSCTPGPDPNLTESGAGRPRVSAEFPETARAGDVVTASLEISNPGPGNIDTIVVSFVRVGDPSLPLPIVEPRRGRVQSGIEAIRPEPEGQSPADATYTFPGLPEGGTVTIEFDLRIPDTSGRVGNSVQVYDGAQVDRAAGVRLETEIRP
jgi:hypothetical protein